MAPALLRVSLGLLAASCLFCLVACAPQNHLPVPHDGSCTAPTLAPGDFCHDVVTYPIATTLLRSKSHLVAPTIIPEHARLIAQNRLDVLSKKAEAEYDVYMNHHLESSKAHLSVEGAMADTDENMGGDGSHARCEALLRKYVCQLQFPRCFDDAAYVDPEAPVHLHVCYSLCHDVRETCGLEHRLNCHHHHALLDHKFVPPTEHELRFDARYQAADPYAEFWRTDCIDAPPSSWKYLFHYLVYGGPGTVALYTLAALLLYAIVAQVMGLHDDSPASKLARLKAERAETRRAFEAKMRKQQKRYVKLQEIKTVMLDQQEEEQAMLDAASAAASASAPPPEVARLQASLRERAAKLAQLDGLLGDLEADIAEEFGHMRRVLEDEARQNEELGLNGPEGERLLAQAEGDEDAEVNGSDAVEEDSVKYFGQRRRRTAAASQPVQQAMDEEDDEYEHVDDDEAHEEEQTKSRPQQRRR